MSNTPTPIGEWSPYQPLTPAEQKIFNTATKDLIGRTYTAQLVSAQVIDGTNYRFKCTASMPPSAISWEGMIEIYQPRVGDAIITNITTI